MEGSGAVGRGVPGRSSSRSLCALLLLPYSFLVSAVAAPLCPPLLLPISTCMAANLQWKRAIGLEKWISNQITGAVPGLATHRSPAVLSAAFRRGVHASVYDKNPDDHVRPAFVPDDVIQLQSAKYWGPHPTTGVFGPADHDGRRPDPAVAASLGNGGCASVLDQKAWFRPLEDVEKPPLA